MHRSRLILGTLLLASVCLVAAPATAVAQPRVAVVLSQSSYDATMPPISAGATQPISLGGTLYSSRVKAAEALLATEFGSVDRIGDAELASLSTLEGYDCVVLVRQVALSRDQRATLRDYVARGGSLVCSFGTGRWDYDPLRSRPFYPLVYLTGSALWEWGELSETMQVGFVNDPPMIAGFTVETHPGGKMHPIMAQAAADLGRTSIEMTASVSDCCELVRTLPAAPGFTPLLMYDHATIKNPDGSRQAVAGSLAGWVSNYHLGRVVYFGFQLHDLARGGSYGSESTKLQAQRVFINAVRWAAQDSRYGVVVKSAGISVTGVQAQGKLRITETVKNLGTLQLNGRMAVALYDPSGAYRGGGQLGYRNTLWPGASASGIWTLNPVKSAGRWRARVSTTYYDYFRGGDAVAQRDVYFSCDGRVFRLAGTSGAWTAGALPAPGPSVEGLDRYEVAASVSATGWADGIGAQRTVVLATGLTPADALAAAPLAGAYDAPLLLTPPRGLAACAAKELGRLYAGEPSATIVVVGDTAAPASRVAQGAVAALRGAGVMGTVSTVRIAGSTAAGTAAKIAERVGLSTTGPFASTVFIVNASAYADALSIAPVAAKYRVPILYVNATSIPGETQAALRTLGARHAVIAGGPGSVSVGVEAWLEKAGYRVAGNADNAAGVDTRLWGATRYDVSVSAVRWAIAYAGMDAGTLGIASGLKWPDSLSAGPLLARRNTPMLLVQGADVNLSPPPAGLLAARRGTPVAFTFFGGPATLSPFVRGQVGALAAP